MDTYDPRYLAGVLFFNERDFFEAHEVWEDLWSESHGNERRFYQGLIQAAVGLFHFSGGNLGGTARLFPLPNLVLFPYVIQPLHVFEPRYRRLLADALAGDRLMAMALLKPGWEEDYQQRPAIHPVVCLGKIFKEERLPDGR